MNIYIITFEILSFLLFCQAHLFPDVENTNYDEHYISRKDKRQYSENPFLSEDKRIPQQQLNILIYNILHCRQNCLNGGKQIYPLRAHKLCSCQCPYPYFGRICQFTSVQKRYFYKRLYGEDLSENSPY